MKILLIQAPIKDNDFLVFPLGLAYLAGSLAHQEQSYILQVLDLNLYPDYSAKLAHSIQAFEPEIIGLSLRNIDNQSRANFIYYYELFRQLIKEIKALSPVPLVVGGAGFSMFAQEIMEQNPLIDYGIFQEGEESFPELLACLHTQGLPDAETLRKVKGLYFQNQGEVVFTGPRAQPDLNTLPHPKREIFELEKYPKEKLAFGIQTKRGCFLNCTYCNYPFLSGSKVRLRPPADIVNEIEEMQGLGINSFMFTDSVFNVPFEHARKICEELLSRNLGVTWGAYFDLRFADPDFLYLAKQAGCRDYVFSPDGISKQGLQGLNKGITRQDIDKTVRLFRLDERFTDRHVFFGFFLNPPKEKLRGLVLTLFYYLKLKVLLKGRGGAGVNWIRIEPYTKVFDLAKEKGQVKAHHDLLPKEIKDQDQIFFSQPPLHILDPLLLSLLKSLHQGKAFLKRIIKPGTISQIKSN